MPERHRHPEDYSSSETEIVLLRSELAELYQSHADKLQLWTADNWEEPTEVVLAGTYNHINNQGSHSVEIQIRQRIDADGIDYLILVGERGEYSWLQVTDNGASRVDDNDTPLASEDTEIIRHIIRHDTTRWDAVESQSWAMRGGMYELADKQAGRRK